MSASVARLARWLGPWSGPRNVPSEVLREELAMGSARGGGTSLDAFVYRPRARALGGSVLLVPGLHYLGPRDPRFDRFARILADAGYLVLAPLLPSYLRLTVVPSVLDELETALDALLVHPLRPRHVRPGMMSISFGSMPALRVRSPSRTIKSRMFI